MTMIVSVYYTKSIYQMGKGGGGSVAVSSLVFFPVPLVSHSQTQSHHCMSYLQMAVRADLATPNHPLQWLHPTTPSSGYTQPPPPVATPNHPLQWLHPTTPSSGNTQLPPPVATPNYPPPVTNQENKGSMTNCSHQTNSS